jgi:hypothetical protein
MGHRTKVTVSRSLEERISNMKTSANSNPNVLSRQASSPDQSQVELKKFNKTVSRIQPKTVGEPIQHDYFPNERKHVPLYKRISGHRTKAVYNPQPIESLDQYDLDSDCRTNTSQTAIWEEQL